MSIRSTHLGLTGAVAAGVLTLTACGDDAAENAGADVDDVATDGGDTAGTSPDAESVAHDRLTFAALSEELEEHAGEPVTVTAEVGKILDDEAFTIASAEASAVDPMLVVSAETVQVEPGADVVLAGTLQKAFLLPRMEEELGIDLDDDRLAEWEQGHYLIATSVNPVAQDVDDDPYVDVEGDPDGSEDGA